MEDKNIEENMKGKMTEEKRRKLNDSRKFNRKEKIRIKR